MGESVQDGYVSDDEKYQKQVDKKKSIEGGK